jgi:hypothetical protein
MRSEVWQPLSVRLAGDEDLREGVPVALRQPLRDWIQSEALRQPSMVARIQVRLGLLPGDEDGDEPDPPDWLAYCTSTKALLDIADAVLSFEPKFPNFVVGTRNLFREAEVRRRKDSLQELLDDARSVYTVKADGSGLERRVGVVETTAYLGAARTAAAKPEAGSAAGHLRAAWNAAHALKPNPVTAYGEAIKAVESAAHAMVGPNNDRATLGTMIGHLRGNPEAFRIVLAGRSGAGGVGTVTAMMALLWDGQTSRHGGKNPTRPETPEEAQAAVYLAVTLVEWFASGAVRRA